MEEKGRVTSVNPSPRTIVNDSERTVVSPRFDAGSIQRAQPAVPLAAVRRRRFPVALVVALCVAASLVGGMMGGALLSLYRKNDTAVSTTAPVEPAATATAPTTTLTTTDAPAAPAVPESPARDESIHARREPSRVAAAPLKEQEETTAAANSRPGDTQAALRSALRQWVAATNARDVGRQMNFYNQNIDAFYLRRNASRDDVRAEKTRVFSRAGVVDIRAGEPDIEVSPDGRTATMRFRKKYVIGGGSGEGRRGEVVQELRWQRTPSGWKITGERDLRVIQ